jgi:HAD superfamily hydrolase (TIGR01509 family)
VVLGDLGGEALFSLLEGRISEAEYWKATASKADWDISPTDLARMVREQFRKAVPGMPRLLARLKDVRLVLLSDHGREWYEYIRDHHGFLDIFEAFFVSFEIGRTKRELDTFRFVISQLDCEAEGCVFIDDQQRNIERAKSVGMAAIHFLDADSLGSCLREMGIISDRSRQ